MRRAVLFPERLVWRLVQWLGSLLPRSRANGFGLREALLHGGRLDTYERYAPMVAKVVAAGKNIRVLDVGAGGLGIGRFLDGFGRSDQVFVLDRFPVDRLAPLVSGEPVTAIIADACRLPFRDGAFDLAVAADSLEHVERSRRPDYCSELRRVTSRGVVLHCPVTSGDGQFAGAAFDQRFMRWFRTIHRHDEHNIAEHIAFGVPTPEELRTLFPGATLEGRQNARVWLRCMQIERIPYLRMFAGLIYWLTLRRRNHGPPFYGAVVEWSRNGG